MRYFCIYLFLVYISDMSVHAQQPQMVLVKGGDYIPLYGTDKNKKEYVNDFYMDITPVTNRAYRDFVKSLPQWYRSKIKRLFADANYLFSWDSDTSYPAEIADSPVNFVSWYAANAYCKCYGKRLPTVHEWEYAAMAGEKVKDARKDSSYIKKILRWYETPKTHKTKVGQSPPNYWGIKDLFGLVWEWTLDFNSIIMTGESRNNAETDKGLFCASGSLGANDLMDYAAFMRYAFRSSLKASFTINSLGFRCVKDVNNK